MAINTYVTESASESGLPIPGKMVALPKSAQLLGTDAGGRIEARSIPVFSIDPEGDLVQPGEIMALWLEDLPT